MSLRRYTVRIGERSFTIDVVETAADRFEVSVDGRVFEAALVGEHDVAGGAISPAMPVPVAAPDAAGVPAPAAPPPVAAATPRPAPRPRTDRSAGVVTAPMPGVVLEVFATPGATLRRGDAVLVLEAMKMRNTIRCPKDGVVAEVLVAAGQPVGPGDVMVRLDLDLAPP